jgi:hypothetical protein
MVSVDLLETLTQVVNGSDTAALGCQVVALGVVVYEFVAHRD